MGPRDHIFPNGENKALKKKELTQVSKLSRGRAKCPNFQLSDLCCLPR